MTSSPTTAPATTGRVLHSAAGYDFIVWLLTHGRSRAFRERLVKLAHLAAGESVLDVGCGTGSLALVARGQIGASGEVVGIDASPGLIARATAKATEAAIDVSFKMAVVEALLFPGAQFDVVLSTLMLHHLPHKVRQQGAREIRRVLKPRGRVLVVDFAHAQREAGFLGHFRRHGHVDPRDVVSLPEETGFRCVESGPVGISSLYFVLAAAGDQCTDIEFTGATGSPFWRCWPWSLRMSHSLAWAFAVTSQWSAWQGCSLLSS